MLPIECLPPGCSSDTENRRRLAAAAIAQFIVMREGLKGRIEDGGLDATAATLTAAVIASTWRAPEKNCSESAPTASAERVTN